jgi:hypothetical protein
VKCWPRSTAATPTDSVSSVPMRPTATGSVAFSRFPIGRSWNASKPTIRRSQLMAA